MEKDVRDKSKLMDAVENMYQKWVLCLPWYLSIKILKHTLGQFCISLRCSVFLFGSYCLAYINLYPGVCPSSNFVYFVVWAIKFELT